MAGKLGNSDGKKPNPTDRSKLGERITMEAHGDILNRKKFSKFS